VKFSKTSIVGAWLIDINPTEDERGFFTRSLCVDTLESHGLVGRMQQQSISFNLKSGTLRGLHFQTAPHEEIKLVRVTKGRIYDVIVDLRADSPSYLQWYAVELSSANHRTIYIPKGVAHGFQTLEASTEVFYQMSTSYAPEYSAGVRWDDPVFSIEWPIKNPSLSLRDGSYSPYKTESL
jgi:dTDP-4-dehydrorhamnose 3,5-epimerase